MNQSYHRNFLWRSSRRTAFAGALATWLVAAPVEAKKLLVRFSSPQQFYELNHDLKVLKSNAPLSRRDLFGHTQALGVRLGQSQALFTDSLENLGMGFVEVSDASDLAHLRATPGVEAVEEDVIFPLPMQALPRTLSSEPGSATGANEAPWGVQAVQAQGAWTQGASGQGVKVAILDTGIDKSHPDLKNRFFSGQDFVRTSFGHDDDDGGFFDAHHANHFGRLLGLQDLLLADDDGNLNEPGAGQLPYPFFDQIGHGTHVAGTIAGEADGHGVVGVAPQAQIMAGRVCGKFGCSNFAVLAGIEWAIANKAQVISMSLGGPTSVKSQQEALARADAAGVVAVAAAGNDGTNQVAFPGAYDTVIGVGAVDSAGHRASFSQFGPELDVVAPGVDVMSSVPVGSGRASLVKVTINGQSVEANSSGFSGAPEVPQALTNNLVAAGLGKSGDFSSAVRGHFALIARGEIAFADKVKNAISAGAAGVVIYNNAPGLISGALTQDGSVVKIPVVMIEQSVGEALLSSLSAGHQELCTMQTLRTDYASFQGTSMATPHVSGVVALILSKNPQLSPAQVRQYLFSTAVPGPSSSENEYGRGLVNAKAAVEAVGQGGF